MPVAPVYEVERDRFGVMYSGPLEIGECRRVVPVEAVERLGSLSESVIAAYRAWTEARLDAMRDGPPSSCAAEKDRLERAMNALAKEHF